MSIAAVVQMTSTPNVGENLSAARSLLEQAAKSGAVTAVLPENFALMGLHERDKLAVAEDDGSGPIQEWLATTARALRLWIIGGTMPLRSRATGKVAAASLLVNAEGQRVARYDKMHLFDVDLPGREESYRESATIDAGGELVTVPTPIGCVGMGVCYDMRFPEMFRRLSSLGAEVLSLPSAFTVPTGLAHWDVLLRARAIENLCFVLAAAQAGNHANGRATFGNAMIVNPWGEILARAPDGPGIAVARIDRAEQQDIRARFPVLSHRRLQC